MNEAPPLDPLLSVIHLKKHFPLFGGRRPETLYAVDDVGFSVMPGETLGLVGESGCGKSTLGRTLLRLLEPTAGEIWFEGRDVAKLGRGEMPGLRRKLQLIFQDPYASLDPRMTVGQSIAEALIVHRMCKGREALNARVAELLEMVGLRADHQRRFPHEFSGGQRQRVGIARALAVNPRMIVCDEPVSALDVSVQAQIVNLLEDLQEKLGLTYLFIAHDLSVVKHISQRVAVMYLGKIIEIGPVDALYGNPVHPYTEALLSAVPIPSPEAKRNRIILQGDLPSPIAPPKGCRFFSRCPMRQPSCETTPQHLTEVSPGHFAACQVRARPQ